MRKTNAKLQGRPNRQYFAGHTDKNGKEKQNNMHYYSDQTKQTREFISAQNMPHIDTTTKT